MAMKVVEVDHGEGPQVTALRHPVIDGYESGGS